MGTHIQGDSLAAAVPPLTTMASIRVAPSRAQRAINLLRTVNSASSSCPCHSNPQHHHNAHPSLNPFAGNRRRLATPMDTSQQKEYAFEMAASSIRFGPGCTKEVGMDFKNLGAKKVMVVTDETVRKLDAMKQVQEDQSRTKRLFYQRGDRLCETIRPRCLPSSRWRQCHRYRKAHEPVHDLPRS